jgi:hypothetical protein
MASGLIVWVKVAGEPGPAVELLKALPEISATEVTEGRVKVTFVSHDSDHSCIADTLVRGGVKLLEVREDELGLEEVFLRVTRGETQ